MTTGLVVETELPDIKGPQATFYSTDNPDGYPSSTAGPPRDGCDLVACASPPTPQPGAISVQAVVESAPWSILDSILDDHRQAEAVTNALIALTASPSCVFNSSVAFTLLNSSSST